MVQYLHWILLCLCCFIPLVTSTAPLKWSKMSPNYSCACWTPCLLPNPPHFPIKKIGHGLSQKGPIPPQLQYWVCLASRTTHWIHWMGAWYFRAQDFSINDPERLESSPNPKSTHCLGDPSQKTFKTNSPHSDFVSARFNSPSHCCRFSWIHIKMLV